MNEFFRRIRYLLNRRRFDQELASDMEFHREMAGTGRSFGNTLRLREDAALPICFIAKWPALAEASATLSACARTPVRHGAGCGSTAWRRTCAMRRGCCASHRFSL